MLKSLSFSAFAAVALAAGAALAAEPATTTPPMAKSGMFVNAKGMTLYTFDKDTRRQVGLQRSVRHQLAAGARRRQRQGGRRLDDRRARRRAEAVGLQGQAGLRLGQGHQARRHHGRRLHERRLAHRQALTVRPEGGPPARACRRALP